MKMACLQIIPFHEVKRRIRDGNFYQKKTAFQRLAVIPTEQMSNKEVGGGFEILFKIKLQNEN